MRGNAAFLCVVGTMLKNYYTFVGGGVSKGDFTKCGSCFIFVL